MGQVGSLSDRLPGSDMGASTDPRGGLYSRLKCYCIRYVYLFDWLGVERGGAAERGKVHEPGLPLGLELVSLKAGYGE